MQDNGPGWQIARLSAVADLLENLPGSCTVLALNGGAAESLVGLHELARVGLASVRRRDSMSTGASMLSYVVCATLGWGTPRCKAFSNARPDALDACTG